MHPALSILNSPDTPTAPSGTPPLAAVHALDDLSVLQAAGADTVPFLQGQLTNDIAGAAPDQSRLAGYCTAQGRLLATMVAWHGVASAESAPTVCALVKHDLMASLIKRLSMFVLRAKVKFVPATLQVVGVTAAPGQLEALGAAIGQALPSVPWQVIQSATGTWIRAPGTGILRWWWIAGPEHAAGCGGLTGQLVRASPAAWHVEDLKAGLPWIEASTQDLFIPQTLNLDLIEGVSFTKGCYPGQEIVARSHYRGTVKRRMALGVCTTDLAVHGGIDVYDGTAPEQPCGRVINAAGAYVLFEAPFDAVDHAALHIGSAHGPALTSEPLPYATRPA